MDCKDVDTNPENVYFIVYRNFVKLLFFKIDLI
jgi:hypothetical protein